MLRQWSQTLGCWQARLKRSDGKTITKTFSVKLYGVREAFEPVKAAREGLLDAVDDKPFLHHVDAKRFAVLRDCS